MAAGRLHESLSVRFGSAAIFRDKDSIGGGKDWIDAIQQNLKADGVVLVLIGDEWAMAADANGKRRLDDPADWNRVEIEEALRLARTVVPVLVDKAEMPGAADLPDPLKPLARCNAVRLRDDDWDADIERLARMLAQHGVTAQEARPAKRSRTALAAMIGAALVATAAGAWYYSTTRAPQVSLSGSWAMTHFNEDGSKIAGTLALQQNGPALTGSIMWPRASRELSNGVVEGTTVEFEAVGPRGAKRVYRGEVNRAGNLIQGRAKGGAAGQADWSAVRQDEATRSR